MSPSSASMTYPFCANDAVICGICKAISLYPRSIYERNNRRMSRALIGLHTHNDRSTNQVKNIGVVNLVRFRLPGRKSLENKCRCHTMTGLVNMFDETPWLQVPSAHRIVPSQAAIVFKIMVSQNMVAARKKQRQS